MQNFVKPKRFSIFSFFRESNNSYQLQPYKTMKILRPTMQCLYSFLQLQFYNVVYV